MRFAVIDLETTGLDPATDRIVEIAVVTENDTYLTRLDPERAMGATHIHNITADDVTDAPTFADIASSLCKLLAGRAIVAHNVAFDLAFLNAEFGRAGLPVHLPREVGVCTMDQSRIYLPDGSHSLHACLERAGLPRGSRHVALEDAMGARALLESYIKADALDQRVCDSAINRSGDTVAPREWDRATRAALSIVWP